MNKEATINEIKNEFKDEKMLLIVSRQQYNMNEINDTINKFKSVFNNVTVKKCCICDFNDNKINSYIDIIHDIESTNTEVHVFFSLQRKTHTCPFCSALTDKIHDYRTSVIKDLPFM